MRKAMMYHHLFHPLFILMIYPMVPVKMMCMMTVVRFLPIAKPIFGS